MLLPIIKNFDTVATTPLRHDALRILEAGYQAVMTEVVIREEIEVDKDTICIKGTNICLSDYRNVYFVGIGKCAVDASVVLEKILGDRITSGIVIDVKSGIFERMRSFVGTHPFPSQTNVSATEEVVKMLTGLDPRDIVFIVVSGGGSSLLCLPHESDCEKLHLLTEKLWQHGADIGEVNTIRKHTSDIQGGQLAKLAYPATVVSFIISDVPGNDIGVIASGPTVQDMTTVDDASKILQKYGLDDDPEIGEIKLRETPKQEQYFIKVMNLLLSTNVRGLEAMRSMAYVLGYDAKIINPELNGIASSVGAQVATTKMPKRTCYLYGGETTVLVSGEGKGGRNQELALAALEVIPPGRVLVACASDGWDNSDIAGAVADAQFREQAEHAQVSIKKHLQDHNAYPFWQEINGAIITGKTGTNVADFCIVLSE